MNKAKSATLSLNYQTISKMRLLRTTAIFSSLLGVFLAISGCNQMPWDKQLSPSYEEGSFPKAFRFKAASPRLESVWVDDSNRLWAVGENGTILKSDDGKHWKSQISGTASFLRAIAGTSDGKRLWVVGDGGTILESQDGENWKPRASGTRTDLRSIFATRDGRHLWAVGLGGTILGSGDGEHWDTQASGTQSDLQAILGTSDGKRVWAVGERGTLLESEDHSPWISRNSGTQEYLWSIFITRDEKHFWVLGADGRVLFSEDGIHWKGWTTGTIQNPTSIFGSSNSSKLWVVGNKGLIMKSEDGKHWNYVMSGTECNLRSLIGTRNGKVLWAVGEQSTILRSEDGEHWNPLTTVLQHSLTSIFGTNNGGRLWTVGEKGIILKSKDGEHWNALTSGTQNDLQAIFVAKDTLRLWAAGLEGTILESEDGEHWKARISGITDELDSVFATNDGKRVWAVGSNGVILGSEGGEQWRRIASGTREGLIAVFGTPGGERLWVVGENGTIIQSSDGEHWKAEESGTKNSLLAVFTTRNGKRQWAAGGRGTILEADEGGHWTVRDSGTTEDIISLFGTDDGKRLWAVGRRGLILQSDDGSHWNRRGSAVRDDLLSVFESSDGNHVWAVGHHGAIIFGNIRKALPVIRQARITNNVSGWFLELRVEKTAAASAPTKIWVEGRNDYDNQHKFPWRKLSECVVKDQDDPDRWQCNFQPSALNLEAGQKVHLLIHVLTDKDDDIYAFTALYDPLQWIKQNQVKLSLAGALLLCIALPTILLFVRPLWNLKIYRAVGLNRIEQLKIPMLGDFVQIAVKLLTVLPWFVKHPRTLDAWIEKHRNEVLQGRPLESASEASSYQKEMTSESQVTYIPLPVRVDNPVSGPAIERPSADEIRKIIKAPRTAIQIIGPGGAGKTTLASQFSEWAMQSDSVIGLCNHPILPIWIDEELDSDKKALPLVIKGKLIASLANEQIEDELFTALLKKQRLLVILDRISERSATTQRYIETIYRSVPIGCLVVTSRIPIAIDGIQSKYIYPQPLNSSTLLNFMTDLLKVLMKESDAQHPGPKPLSRIEEQLELGKRLASLIRLNTIKGEEDVPLVPLVVRLFVEQAVRLLQAGKTLDQLPLSLPDVYFQHLRQVNPTDPSVPHFLDVDRMLSAAKLLGKLALGQDYIPKEFSKEQAIAALAAGGEMVTAASNPLVRLKLNGVLLEKAGGFVTRFRFSLDPMAEFLAAAAYADECRKDSTQWEAILSQSNGAPGFQVALQLVRQAYSEGRA